MEPSTYDVADSEMYETATMASGCSSEETLSVLKPCDLTTAISQGTVSEEMLERCAQEGHIDVRNEEGQTPLMLACLTGLENVVKFLLANGANPNSNSLMKGNTPLHFACTVEDTGEEEYLSKRCYKPQKWKATKVSIVKLLLEYGASVQKNRDGWTPACVAAFYMFKDIVDFFLLIDDGSPLEDKITASQILGVSQATLDKPALKDAFHSFNRALELQQDAGVITGQAETSEVALCFSKLSLTEFHTSEEIWSVRSSENALKAHAFLVGERLFPQSLKQRYLYPSLTHFASLLMYNEDMVEAGFQIFSCTLGFERRGELQLGTVLGHIASNYEFHCVYDGKKAPQPLVRQRARDLLCAYDSVVNNVNIHIDSLSGMCHLLMDSLGEILFAEVFSGFGFDDLKSTLEDVEKLLRIIQGRVFREKQDEYPKMPSVAHKIMKLLLELLDKGRYLIDRSHLLKVKFLLLRVLLWDNASYQDVLPDDASYEDESGGNTLLHFVAYFTYSVEYMECIQDLAQDLALVLLRHGCPLDAVNEGGYTATDLLGHSGFEDQNINLIQTMVSPPTTVLRLEEAAARVVLRHKINYLDLLPLRLRELVDGGTAELELELVKLVKTNEDSSEDSSEDNE